MGFKQRDAPEARECSRFGWVEGEARRGEVRRAARRGEARRALKRTGGAQHITRKKASGKASEKTILRTPNAPHGGLPAPIIGAQIVISQSCICRTPYLCRTGCPRKRTTGAQQHTDKLMPTTT